MNAWTSKTPPEIALGLADDLEARLDRLPEITGDSWQDRDAARGRRHDALAGLAQSLQTLDGASITNNWQGSRFTLAGVTATSTSALDGAMRYWIAQVRQKAGAAR